MDIVNLFRDVRLTKTEITALRYIQNNPEQCLQEGVRSVAIRCFSNPSSLVRLAKKLGFSGWLEMVYFIKFNITQPRMDVTTDRDFMQIQSDEGNASLFSHLQSGKILIHGSGFSQLIAQYIYNKLLVTGVNASLALWPDYDILEQKTAAKFDAIWIISKSGRSSSALKWIQSLEHKNIELVCFTGDYQSPLARAASTAIIIHDPQKYDDDIYWSNPFFGYCILGFENLLKRWFDQKSAARN